jgi:hypothetical protein
MIETIEDFLKFSANSNGDWIVHVVPVEEDLHPADNLPCILFIHVISSGKTYFYSCKHPDSIPKIKLDEFIGKLSESKNKKWALDKKSFSHFFNLQNVYDANMCYFLKENTTLDLSEFDTVAHTLVRRNCRNEWGINKIIPIVKHLESFNNLCEEIIKIICPVDSQMKMFNNVIIDSLGKLESNGIFVNREIFREYFELLPNKNGMVFSQYNVYTSTGRPSNRFGKVNFAALQVSNGCRKAFVSRHGNDGKIVVIDYTAFHPRIICTLTNYNIDVNINIYEYLAKLYFKKTIVDEFDIIESKKLTFKQLYGGVESKYAHIKYLANLNTYINNQWDYFKDNGHVLTPIFKRKITYKHIIDPSPTKVFNYILQAVEGEIAISRLQKVMSFLKNKRTMPILYTYDSLIYDFHNEDGMETIRNIQNIMSGNGLLPIKTYMGESYQSAEQVEI